MTKYDIKDQYGGKIGEVRDQPKLLGGSSTHSVHDQYGGKVGEVRSSGGGVDGAIERVVGGIFGVLLTALLFVVGFLFRAWFNFCRSTPKVGIPLTVIIIVGAFIYVARPLPFQQYREPLAAEAGDFVFFQTNGDCPVGFYRTESGLGGQTRPIANGTRVRLVDNGQVGWVVQNPSTGEMGEVGEDCLVR